MLFEHPVKDKNVTADCIIYNLTEECVKAHPMIMLKDDPKESFYAWLRKAMNVGDEYRMNCTKIHIAQNIQDEWVNYAKESKLDDMSINMVLLDYAPRVDALLGENQISIYDGFLTKSEE